MKLVRGLRTLFFVGILLFIAYVILTIWGEVQPPLLAEHLVFVGEHWLEFTDPSLPRDFKVGNNTKEMDTLRKWQEETGLPIYYDYDRMRTNLLKEGDAISYVLLLSKSPSGPDPAFSKFEQVVGDFETIYSWKFRTSLKMMKVFPEGFETIDISEGETEERLIDRIVGKPSQAKLSFELRATLWRNAPLYLHVYPVNEEGSLMGPSSTIQLAREVKPDILQRPRRFLLRDPSGGKMRAEVEPLPKSLLAIPTNIEVSPVIEHRPLSQRKMRKMLGPKAYGIEGEMDNHYSLPVHVNIGSPRDEYVPLVTLDGLERSTPYRRDRTQFDLKQCSYSTNPFDLHGLNPMHQEVPDEELHALGLLETWKLTGGEPSPIGQEWRDIRDQTITITFKPVGYAYWHFQTILEETFDIIENQIGLRSYDVDSLRMMVSSTSPWVLALLYAISLLHLLFQSIAITSDIWFWKTQKSYEGFSVNALFLDFCLGLIVIVYLRDAGESFLVQIFLIARLFLLVWKMLKLVRVSVDKHFPFVRFTRIYGRAGKNAYQAQIEVDEMRWMKRLFALVVPIVVGVAAYQLIYVAQRSWTSWLIHSLAVCAYMGGFVTMTPQVYRNYALKSVEHMPWKVLFYQFLNTFIDDVFALVIRMPDMHRMSVLRDDVIFLVYLAQRWMYPKRRKATD